MVHVHIHVHGAALTDDVSAGGSISAEARHRRIAGMHEETARSDPRRAGPHQEAAQAHRQAAQAFQTNSPQAQRLSLAASAMSDRIGFHWR